VHAVDKDFMAVEYTAKNAQLSGLSNIRAYLSNGLAQVPPEQKFDVIVSNIPAKIGGELLSIMLQDSYARLKPGGKLYVVTISGLKDYMKRHLTGVFGNYKKLKQSKTYTAAVAIKEWYSPPRAKKWLDCIIWVRLEVWRRTLLILYAPKCSSS